MLAPHVFYILLAAVIYVALRLFAADNIVMGALVSLRMKQERVGRRQQQPGIQPR